MFRCLVLWRHVTSPSYFLAAVDFESVSRERLFLFSVAPLCHTHLIPDVHLCSDSLSPRTCRRGRRVLRFHHTLFDEGVFPSSSAFLSKVFSLFHVKSQLILRQGILVLHSPSFIFFPRFTVTTSGTRSIWCLPAGSHLLFCSIPKVYRTLATSRSGRIASNSPAGASKVDRSRTRVCGSRRCALIGVHPRRNGASLKPCERHISNKLFFDDAFTRLKSGASQSHGSTEYTTCPTPPRAA